MGLLKSTGIFITSKILSILLVLIIFAASFNVLLHSDIYINALEENNVYEELNIPDSQARFIEGGVEGAVNSSLEEIFDYIHGDSDNVDLTVSIDEEELVEFFEEEAEKLPECETAEELLAYESGNINCIPPETNISEAIDVLVGEGGIPSLEGGEVDLAEVYGVEESQLEKIRSYVNYYKISLYASVFAALILAGLLFLLSGRNLKSFSKKLGIILFFAGVSSLIAAFISFSYFESQINTLNIEIDIAKEISTDLVSSVLGRAKLYSYIMAGIGLVIFGLSFFSKRLFPDSSLK